MWFFVSIQTRLFDSNLSGDIQNYGSSSGSHQTANWRPDPDVVTQVVEGETVLVHLQTNEIFALNPTATRAWDLLAAGRTRDEVQEALRIEFDVPPDQLRDEIDALIAKLVDKRLLQAES